VARNLGLVMRKVFGIGTPRGLQAEGGLSLLVWFAWIHVHGLLRRWLGIQPRLALAYCNAPLSRDWSRQAEIAPISTGC
jgi:hypothetical protein